MKKMWTLGAMMAITLAKAQSTDPNVGIGLAAPNYGINIRANFPGGNGGWARGYKISNHNNTATFIELGSFGGISDGVSTVNYSFIGTAHDKTFMVFQPDGNIGVGTTAVENTENWARAFQVHGTSSAKSLVTTATVRSGLWSHHTGFYGAPAGGITGTHSNHAFSIITNASSKMTVLPNGNVGIATSSPQAKLAVNGNILANEIKVKTDITVPDYVFEPDYALPSLSEIAAYVKQHRHLPEVPSGKEIAADGLDLAQMNLLLLKKVEELTLHLIEVNKKLAEQGAEIKLLKAK